MNCVPSFSLNPAFINEYVCVDSLFLSRDLICGALISLIHKQHMDGGVEERTAENWWQTKRTPLLLPFAPCPPVHSTDTHPSILPPGNVEGQNRVKPAG